MLRMTLGGIVGWMLLAGSLAPAQSLMRSQPSTVEPPMAEPGETKPAPPTTVVAPGQPRRLPMGLEVEPLPPRADLPTGVEPAQYVAPAPAPNGAPGTQPTVLYPEPPTPVVKISVKGPDIGATGQELTYKLTVANTSTAKAHNVIARCTVPRGAKLVKALPQPNTEGKEIDWNLETLDGGATRSIEVVFKPDAESTELAVVAKVQFEHGRYVKTKLSPPTLEMKKVAPPQGILNDPMTHKIVVTNPGKVAVSDIQIVDTLPDGLEYVQETTHGTAIPVSKVGPAPNQRTWSIAILKPNESRTIEYRVMPRKTGEWTSEAVASATGVQIKAGSNTAIQEAKLTLQVTGPANDKGTAAQPTPFVIFVHNTGTAILHNVRITCTFPAEMRLAKASNGSQLSKDSVQWVIPKLEAKETKELSLSLTAPSAGLRDINVSAKADKGPEQRKKLPTVFEGIPALNWQTEGTAVTSPGQEITYTITVKNPGSAPAKNVKVIADLPEQVEFRQAQPAFQRGQGAVFFNTFDVRPKQEVTLKIVAVAKKAGEARFHFEMSAEGMSSGPLKNSKATTISPGGEGEPKDKDPTRVGAAPPEKNPEPKKVVPAGHVSPESPISPPAPESDR
jgi:uncharacterized repeat protein (TIGR01451 family)